MDAQSEFTVIDVIFHPSDFSETSQVAFAHGLRLALAFNADLKLLHVTSGNQHVHRRDFPGIRETLQRWGMLPPDSSPAAVGRLGIDVEKVVVHSRDVVSAVTNFLAENPASLAVLAAHRPRKKLLWFGHSRAEPIARQAATLTLFIPDDVVGFVALVDGALTLKTVLIPVAAEPPAGVAIRFIEKLFEALRCSAAQIHVLHIGTKATLPAIPRRSSAKIQLVVQPPQVSLEQSILDFSQQISSDLIVMPTKGHDGFLDALRGSTTEQVLRNSRCPVLAITAD